jgi:nickel-dependent lactate racemase
MIYFETGTENTILSSADLEKAMYSALEKLGDRKKILIIPPDFTRFHSRAGELTTYAYRFYGDKIKDILPALGTHTAMTEQQLSTMFKEVPKSLFRVHNWRKDVVTLGRIPSSFVHKVTEGRVSYDFPAQVNKMIVEGQYDLILSIGQVVPHEVIGMANYNKNLLVGTGGAESINKSHFAGAAYGMERVMGRADNPVRALLNKAAEDFLSDLPVIYVHTVVARDEENGQLVTRGLYVGDDYSVFTKAAELSLKVNFTMLERPLKKVVVYLDPSEFKSTWLGNKSIYRTRMAIADGGELIILAPGLKEFGEDKEIDRLIRKYGYTGTPRTLENLEKNEELKNNLSAAAHLIHGSSEGRFSITYCPGFLSREEIESVHFNYAPLSEMIKKYDPARLKDGFNLLPGGEEVFFISNPAIGLWANKKRFSS